jgi:nicotinate-nucleotide adenylyltransferase
MEQRKRIAIYGGTFDPVHTGHTEIARRVTQLFEIDTFLFVPARVAPHKFDREVSPAFHRYAMLALATQTEPQLCISTFELDGPGRQYTVDTLSYFRSRFGASTDLFFVMGADSWNEITTWHEWRRLMTLSNLVVVTRPGYEIRTEQVDAEPAARVVDLRESKKGERPIAMSRDVQKIFFTDLVMLDISATDIRRAAEKNSDELNSLVPIDVAKYIRKYQLYRNKHEA